MNRHPRRDLTRSGLQTIVLALLLLATGCSTYKPASPPDTPADSKSPAADPAPKEPGKPQ